MYVGFRRQGAPRCISLYVARGKRGGALYADLQHGYFPRVNYFHSSVYRGIQCIASPKKNP